MKSAEIKGSVIWRLPGTDELQVLESGTGDDRFLIAAFDKKDIPRVIKGTIRSIRSSEFPDFFSGRLAKIADDHTSTSCEEYIDWVKRAKAEIQAGNIAKVVIARRQWKQTEGSIQDFFARLQSANPQAFVYAFILEDQTAMFGASPETLLTRKGELMFTEALGGTKTREQYSEKEILEHSHISEYIAGILGAKKYAFSRDATTVRRAGPVEHLITGFQLSSKGFETDLELASAMHPTPAICGFPYPEAFEFIKRTENFDRKLYSGFLGPLYPSGDFNLFVNLRCAEWYRDGIVLYAGAGLNGMSDPQDEWDETARKMQTVMQSVGVH